MEMYLTLLLAAAAPAGEPVIAGEIRARPVPLWETTRGLVDDRQPLPGGALPRLGDRNEASPRLAYDLTDIGNWNDASDRHEVAFEEALDMARQAREEIAAVLEFGRPD